MLNKPMEPQKHQIRSEQLTIMREVQARVYGCHCWCPCVHSMRLAQIQTRSQQGHVGWAMSGSVTYIGRGRLGARAGRALLLQKTLKSCETPACLSVSQSVSQSVRYL